MNKKNYKKKLEFQQQIISRQSEQIEKLKLQNDKLKLKLKEKENIINSFANLKDELVQNVAKVKKYKQEYKGLINELRKMKEIINITVYKGRWWLVRLLIK